MRNVFKTKFEYCHITDDKVIITKTPEVEDLITDYSKFVTYMNRTLMVFYIFIPLFTALSVLLFFLEKYDISIISGLFALFFLLLSFYSIIFTSGTPVIPKNKIIKITVRKSKFTNSIKIKFKDSNRTKYRGLILTNSQIDEALEILRKENLIENKNIKGFSDRKAENISFYLSFLILFPILYYAFSVPIINFSNYNTFSLSLIYGIAIAVIFSLIKKLIYLLVIKIKKETSKRLLVKNKT